MKMKKLLVVIDAQCATIASVVGTGVHAYSQWVNDEHVQVICDDFANERYFDGVAKATIPYLLPYFVSFYARRKAQKEAQGKINNLEEKIEQLEKY